MTSALALKALAETVGTAVLVAVILGSGRAAQVLSPGNARLQLVGNAVIIGVALTFLILVLQTMSSSFNPVVTLSDTLLHRLPVGEALVLVGAQVVGGCSGALLVHGLDAWRS